MDIARAIIPPVEVPTIKSKLSESFFGTALSNSLKKVAEARPLTPPPSMDKTYLVIVIFR